MIEEIKSGYEELFEEFSSVICICDGDTIMYVNKAGARAFGAANQAALIGHRFSEFVTGEYKEVLENGFGEIIDDISFLPLKLKGLKGKVIETEINVIPIGTEDEPSFLLEIGDITKIKKTSEVGIRREALLRQIIESMTEAFLNTDEDGTILSVNPAAASLLGHEREELIGQHIGQIITRQGGTIVLSKESPYQNLARAIGFDTNNQGMAIRKDGSEFPVEFNLTETMGESRKSYTYIVKDITARTEREEEKLRLATLVFDVAGEGMMVADADLSIIVVNPAFTTITGYEAVDAIGQNPDILHSHRHPEGFFVGLLDIIKSDGHWHGEVWYRRKNGDVFPVWLSLAALREGGKAKYFISVFRDLTKTKEKELAYQASEEKYRHLVEGVGKSHIIYSYGVDGTFEYASPSVRSVLGYEPEEFLLYFLDYLTDNSINDEFIQKRKRSLAGEGQQTHLIEVLHKDGSMRILEVTETPRFDPHGQVMAVEGIAQDITERKALEEQLNRAHRMEAVGQLTGGIAHDFNNLLSIMIGRTEMLGDLIGDDENAKSDIDALMRAIGRASSLTDRLLAFSRKQSLSPRPTAINSLVAGLDDMLQRSLGETIELRTHLGLVDSGALIDPHQFENALVNLALNARDAMPDGGALSIETAAVTLDDAYAEQYAEVLPGDYVKVAVSDTGTGMEPEVLEKVFEPFFTTKEVGKGSGLGLSMVYGFVKQSNGHITVNSEIGKGTTVELYMPRSSVVALDKINGGRPELASGSERILLVEDDEDVRKVSATLLRAQGYEIVEAGNGEAAIRHLKDGQTFDLLFTDVVLPGGMNGVKIADLAKQIQPGIRVLYTSGYAENTLFENQKMEQKDILLNKPYRRADLLEKIRSMLDGNFT